MKKQVSENPLRPNPLQTDSLQKNPFATVEQLKSHAPYFLAFGVSAFIAALAFDPTASTLIGFKGAIALSVLAAVITAGLAVKYRKAEDFTIQLGAGIATVLVFASTLFLMPQLDNSATVFATCCVLVLLIWFMVFSVTGKLNAERVVLLLIAAGFLVRLIYGINTPVTVRQHDVEQFGSGIGHAGYIEYFYNNMKLPDFDPTTVWQFYHPPLHHFLSATWLKVMTAFGLTWERALESIQFLTAFYSTAALLISVKLFKIMGLKSKGLVLAAALMAFSPSFIIFSGSVNNDILSIAFALAAIYATLKWVKTGKWIDIIRIALFIGLGMSTKQSIGAIAPAIALVFLLELAARKGERRRVVGQIAVFAVICIPLGLWWPVRNHFLFDSPLAYIPMLDIKSYQYVGYYSFVDRFLFPPPVSFSSNFMLWGIYWNQPTCEFNVWSGLFKTAAFGEYNIAYGSKAGEWLATVLSVANIAVGLTGFGAMVCYLFKKKSMAPRQKIFIACVYVFVLLSYLSFCYTFAHTCTMNMRYASPLLVIGSYFFARLAGDFLKREKAVKAVGYVMAGITGVFCLSSAIIYTTLGG